MLRVWLLLFASVGIVVTAVFLGLIVVLDLLHYFRVVFVCVSYGSFRCFPWMLWCFRFVDAVDGLDFYCGWF